MLSVLAVVLADTETTPCAPGAPVTGIECASPLFNLADTFENVLGILIPIGGIVLFVMLLVGGFSLLTSSGVPQKVQGAQATITYAIAGIVVLALAFLIIQIIANFVGVPAILEFNIYQGQ